MPKVFDLGPYTIYFWVGEGNPLEPVHVHVTEGTPSPNDTKFWITRSGGAILCHNKGNIGLKRLRDIQSIIESQHRLVTEKWLAKFGEITYFC